MGFIEDPSNVYFGVGWVKRYSEKLAEFYYRQYGMEILVVRPSNIYGPYDSFDPSKSHVLPALIRKFVENNELVEVWGTPDVARDFIFIDDFVSGVLTAFESFTGFDVYNIASGNIYTIGESVNLISELTNYKGEIKYNDSKPMTIFKRVIDITKARKVLGFQAKTSFRDGLQKTIDYFRYKRSASGGYTDYR
jgi:GDP-L-fucose synthase